ncbi:MAG: multicomponent Na+:H+ antiporter subunit C [Myxococcota bacterium]
MNLVIALTIGSLYTAGVWLLLQRSLSRIVIGLAIIGHGANLLLLTAGGPGGIPPVAGGDVATTSDPLPQALALTAIVITFGVSAFLLSMAYRNWIYRSDDEVEDDVEDRRIAEARRRIEGGQQRSDARTAHEDGEVAT